LRIVPACMDTVNDSLREKSLAPGVSQRTLL
jgi:hypothetical protein